MWIFFTKYMTCSWLNWQTQNHVHRGTTVQSSTVWRSGTYIILFSFIFAYLNSFNCSIIQRISRDNSFQTSFYIFFLGFTGNIKTSDISNDQALKTWNHILFSPCNFLQPLFKLTAFSLSVPPLGLTWELSEMETWRQGIHLAICDLHPFFSAVSQNSSQPDFLASPMDWSKAIYANYFPFRFYADIFKT